jgi:hypothetical protein
VRQREVRIGALEVNAQDGACAARRGHRIAKGIPRYLLEEIEATVRRTDARRNVKMSVVTKDRKEKIKSAAAASVGAGVGGAGGATAGVLELAAQGSVTALSAGIVIGVGAVAGGALTFLGYKLYHRLRRPKS